MSLNAAWTRRAFVAGASALAAGTVLRPARHAAAEPAPETRKLRLVLTPAICLAPQYLAEELLRLEGFEKVEYLDMIDWPGELLATGRADMTMDTAPAIVAAVDAGRPVVSLAGVHAGCYELIGHRTIQAVPDVKNKLVAISAYDAGDHLFLAAIAAYVGLDPRRDIRWLETGSVAGSMEAFVEGTADAFLGFAPQPQELRARKIGHVVLDTAQDRPWSQYFCCMVTANRDFVARHPVAAKRALRAFLKAADICARQPERAARLLAAKGYEPRYEIGLEVISRLPYKRWREADAEDTLRFHALRLHEGGMIRSTPQKVIAQGADWRFLNELKKELKA